MEFVPRQFKFGVLLPNNYYYAAINQNDFSVIRTGFISEELNKSEPQLFKRDKSKIVFSEKNVNLYFDKIIRILSDTGTYLCTLDERTVIQLKGFSRSALAFNKQVKRSEREECNFVFKPLENSQLLIKNAVSKLSYTNPEGAGDFNIILDNVNCAESFTLPCQHIKHLPRTDVEVRVGKNGVISFSSVTLDVDVHIVQNIPKEFYEQLPHDTFTQEYSPTSSSSTTPPLY